MEKYPPLPVELVIDVLSFAVRLSHSTAISVSLVCSWAREIALPVVWEVVTINPSFQIAGSSRKSISSVQRLNARTDTFPAARAPLVRAIWADKTRLGERSIRSVFDLCRSARDLALSWDRFRDVGASQYLYNRADLSREAECGWDHPENLHYPRPHRESPCRSLTVLGPWVMFTLKEGAFSTRTGCSIFLNLTHLRLTDFTNRVLPLARLPNLTHLAVPPPKRAGGIRPETVGADLPGALASDRAPVLEMVVLTADLAVEKRPLGELQRLLAAVDERLYVVHAPCRVHHVKEVWERSSQGGETLWDQAIREREQVG